MTFGNVEQNFDEEGIREDERNKVLEELEKKMLSYFGTGYESEEEHCQFVVDCFKELRTKEREQG